MNRTKRLIATILTVAALAAPAQALTILADYADNGVGRWSTPCRTVRKTGRYGERILWSYSDTIYEPSLFQLVMQDCRTGRMGMVHSTRRSDRPLVRDNPGGAIFRVRGRFRLIVASLYHDWRVLWVTGR